MPLRHHDLRRIFGALDELNPAQIEDALTKTRDLRRKTEAISEIAWILDNCPSGSFVRIADQHGLRTPPLKNLLQDAGSMLPTQSAELGSL